MTLNEFTNHQKKCFPHLKCVTLEDHMVIYDESYILAKGWVSEPEFDKNSEKWVIENKRRADNIFSAFLNIKDLGLIEYIHDGHIDFSLCISYGDN